jgi:hypothetical protein
MVRCEFCARTATHFPLCCVHGMELNLPRCCVHAAECPQSSRVLSCKFCDKAVKHYLRTQVHPFVWIGICCEHCAEIGKSLPQLPVGTLARPEERVRQ